MSVPFRPIRGLLERHRGLDPRWLAAAVRRPSGTSDEDWDAYYRDGDPYGYDASDYEQRRFHTMLAALEGRRFDSGLEIACSVGAFTERLAPRCGHLLAVDVATPAVEAARARLAGCPNVRVERARLPEGFPAGSFDLIVCADMSEYLDRRTWAEVVRRIEGALRPGGSFLATFWRPYTPSHRTSGDAAARMVRRRTGLLQAWSRVESRHRIERFDQPGS